MYTPKHNNFKVSGPTTFECVVPVLHNTVNGVAVGNWGFKINFPSQSPKHLGWILVNTKFEAGGLPTEIVLPPFSPILLVTETTYTLLQPQIPVTV